MWMGHLIYLTLIVNAWWMFQIWLHFIFMRLIPKSIGVNFSLPYDSTNRLQHQHQYRFVLNQSAFHFNCYAQCYVLFHFVCCGGGGVHGSLYGWQVIEFIISNVLEVLCDDNFEKNNRTVCLCTCVFLKRSQCG